MSKEKQIEELLNELIRTNGYGTLNAVANHLYEAGYRKMPDNIGDFSDGYHTFNELYHHRAILFSVICNSMPDKAWKSKLHDTGDMFDGMFIVGIETPDGQATYHYDVDPYWDMFDCKELDRAPEWDGHTSDDAIARIATLGARTCKTCKHAHMTIDGKHCKWCSIMATHDIDSDEWSGSPNGYDPEPYFDADFFCGNYEPKEG